MSAMWDYRDPLEPALAAQVSEKTLMEHVRTIGALERESGSPGEAQAYDYIERILKSYGVEVSGRYKAEAAHAVLEGEFRPDDLPAQLVNPKSGNLYWMLDSDAASLLTKE